MIIKATQTYTRQAPRKVRLVANAVKKMPIEKAIQQLGIIERKASLDVLKVLRQAVANAMNNHGLAFNDLSIKSIQVQNGPYYKRFRAVSKGRAHSIYKKTSHIMVELETADKSLPAKSETKSVKSEIKVKAKTEKKVATSKTKAVVKSKKKPAQSKTETAKKNK